MEEMTGIAAISRDVLVITEKPGAEACASALGEMLGCIVQIASSRKAGVTMLRKHIFGAVLVDDNLADADPEWADQVWSVAGLAMPLRVNFAICGVPRLAREVRNALMRRDGEQAIARRAVTAELENELKGSVTGLLLQSQLALREPAGSTGLEPKLRSLVELAGALQVRLRGVHA